MFHRMKRRFGDMKTLTALISGADEQAQLSGEEEPGAEHYLLSALTLSDGSAARVFERVGVDPNQFRDAVHQQYDDALQSVGINANGHFVHPEPIASSRVFHNSKPSGQAVIKALYALRREDQETPLLGAHVVDVVTKMNHGVAARALRAMGVDPAQITQAIHEELSTLSQVSQSPN